MNAQTAKKRALIWIAVSSKAQAEDDKISLKFQEAQARQWCSDNGYTIVEVLSVPGHSRSESDIITLLEDYAASGVYAYHNLRRAWQEKTFDVLVAYSLDRLARSSTLIAYVIENTVKSGASLYLLEDGGMVTSEDFRFKIAIGGISVTQPMDTFRQKSMAAKEQLTQRGLPAGKLPFTHQPIRNSGGKAVGIQINPDTVPLLHDAAHLILEGVAWRYLEKELHERYGHVRPNGRPYATNSMYKVLYNPLVWGHTARYHRINKKRSPERAERNGTWCYDPSATPPPHVIMAYNVIEPVFTGDFADRLRAELRRREQLVGHASPNRSHMFSGIALCGACGYSMVVFVTSRRGKKFLGSRKLRCSSRHTTSTRTACAMRHKMVTFNKVQQYLTSLLDQLLEHGDVSALTIKHNNHHAQITDLQATITTLDTKIKTLIREQSIAPESVQAFYRSEIATLSTRLTVTTRQLDDLTTTQQQRERDQHHAQQALLDIRAIRDAFWQLPERRINQLLHRLLGDVRLVCMDGEVVGISKRSKS